MYALLNVKKEAPQIVELDQSIMMMGVKIRTNEKDIYRDAAELGKRYAEVKKSGIIQHKREPWAFVAVSKGYGEESGWDYLMGDVVTEIANPPQGLIAFEIPAGTYAKFTLQPRTVFLWGPAMGLMKKFIYSEWLPSSGFELDGRFVDDFEYHDQRSLGKNPQIDLYVAVKRKEA